MEVMSKKLVWLFGVLAVFSSASVAEMPRSNQNPSPEGLPEAKNYKTVNAEEFQTLQQSPSVGIVFFYKKLGEVKLVKMFLSEYDKSAGFLNTYGLKLGLVDCTSNLEEQLKKACGEAEQKVYAYRKGSRIYELDLETMFDVNSIVSNILQLALLDEVRIVQTKKHREELEHENAGQNDIIYSYHNAIGTYEHRVYMEIAYAYQDKYKFVMSSEPASVVGLQDYETVTSSTISELWVLYCHDKYNVKTGCRSVKYKGEISLIELAKFFKLLSWPRVIYRSMHKNDEDSKNPCEHSEEYCCIYIFHIPEAAEKVDDVVQSLQFDVHGFAGLVVIETEQVSGEIQLTLTRSGAVLVMDKYPWTLENVEYFLATHLFSATKSEDKHNDQAPETIVEDEEEEEVTKIDDMVMAVAWEWRKQLGKNCPNIPMLTDRTFYLTIQSSKLAVVLFYLPYDAQGMLFLEPFQETGLYLAALKGDDPSAHPLLRINCFDWTDVCQKENITTYPVIRFYRDQGTIVQPYLHALDKYVFTRSVRLLQLEQPLMLKTAEEVEKFAEGQIPEKMVDVMDNFVLLKSDSEKDKLAFREVAKRLETVMLFAIVDPSVQSKMLPERGIVHVRPWDKGQRYDTLATNLDADSIYNFLHDGQFHFFPELTHLNFPALYARKKPFGVLFLDTDQEDELSPIFVDMIKNKEFPNIIWCKMTVDANDELYGNKILKEYAGDIVLPSVAYVDHHQEGKVYLLTMTDKFSKPALMSWLEDINAGTVKPTRILANGHWKPPGPHFDFLTKMDRENEFSKAKQQDSAWREIKKMETRQPKDCPSGQCDKYEAFEGDGTQDQLLKEMEEQDDETRAQLLELQKSRLYSSGFRNPMKASKATLGSSKMPEMEKSQMTAERDPAQIKLEADSLQVKQEKEGKMADKKPSEMEKQIKEAENAHIEL